MPSLLQLWAIFLKRWNLLILLQNTFLKKGLCLGLDFRVFFFHILEFGCLCLKPRPIMNHQGLDEYFDIDLG